jgi:hypothetical protein
MRSGLECLSELRAGGVRVPALVITREDADRLDQRLGPDDVVLRKPFEMPGFGGIVTRLLSSRSPGDLAP